MRGTPTQQGRGHDAAHLDLVARRQTSLQQPPQILSLLTGEHGVAIGEVDAADAQLAQRPPHRRRLAAGTHQDGDIPRLQRRIPQPRTVIGEPLMNLCGTGGRQPLPISTRRHRLVAVGGAPRQWWHRLPPQGEPIRLAPGPNRLERDRLVIDEGSRTLGKQAIDPIDQRLGRAKVGLQGVMSGDLRLGLDIGEDVGATKAVDGLFRVADEIEAAAGLPHIQPAEDPVLLRIRILKLVDHRHRIELADPLGQQLAGRPLQRLRQTTEQIVEGQQLLALLGLLDPLPHLAERLDQHPCADIQGLGKQLVDRDEQRMLGRIALGALRHQGCLREALELVAEPIILGGLLCPGANLRQPVRQVLARIAAFIDAGTGNQGLQIRGRLPPLSLERLDTLQDRLMVLLPALRLATRRHQLRRPQAEQIRGRQMGSQILQQSRRLRPVAADRPRQRERHPVAVLTPEVGHRLEAQPAIIADKFGIKQ